MLPLLLSAQSTLQAALTPLCSSCPPDLPQLMPQTTIVPLHPGMVVELQTHFLKMVKQQEKGKRLINYLRQQQFSLLLRLVGTFSFFFLPKFTLGFLYLIHVYPCIRFYRFVYTEVWDWRTFTGRLHVFLSLCTHPCLCIGYPTWLLHWNRSCRFWRNCPICRKGNRALQKVVDILEKTPLG